MTVGEGNDIVLYSFGLGDRNQRKFSDQTSMFGLGALEFKME